MGENGFQSFPWLKALILPLILFFFLKKKKSPWAEIYILDRYVKIL